MRYYKKVMTPAQIQSIYKVYSENAVTNIDITVDTSKEVREISLSDNIIIGDTQTYNHQLHDFSSLSDRSIHLYQHEV